jgi:hypothetical protein
MFQEALQFCFTIVLNYSKKIVMIVIGRVPPPLTCQISQIIVDFFSSIVSTCVHSQSCGHWFLSDVLHFAISMSLKLKEENQVVPSFQSFNG